VADTTKDSFNESLLHTKVVFQRGKDVLDFELNEFQDILRIQQYRSLVAQSGNLNPGSNDDGYLVVGTGEANSVTVKAGSLFCDGIPIILTEDLTYDAFTTYGGGGFIYDTVYLMVSEQETADPASIVQLGETTRRRKLFLELGHVTGVDLPPDSLQAVWEGGTRYFALARIKRVGAIADIDEDDVVDLRKRLPAFTIKRYTDQYAITPVALIDHTHDYNPPGASDAFVIRQAADADIDITGFEATAQYRRRIYINLGPGVQTLRVEDSDSLAANRILALADIVMRPNEVVDMTYDVASSRWRAVFRESELVTAADIRALDNDWTGTNAFHENFFIDGPDTTIASPVIDIGNANPGDLTRLFAPLLHVFSDELRVEHLANLKGSVTFDTAGSDVVEFKSNKVRFVHGFGLVNEEPSYVDVSGAPDPQTFVDLLSPVGGSSVSNSSAQWYPTVEGFMEVSGSSTGGTNYFRPVSFPHGATITRIRAGYSVSATGVAAAQFECRVYNKLTDAQTVVGANHVATTGSGLVTMDSGAVSFVVDSSNHHFNVWFQASGNPGAISDDKIKWIEVTYTLPGLRGGAAS
jgi:hypothetical protein